MEDKIYRCSLCGKMVNVLKDSDAELICCGATMSPVDPKTKESLFFKEKHMPVYRLKGNKVIVYVGVTPHPSTEDHYIEWIAIRTNLGYQRKSLKPGDAPKATFILDENEHVEEIYAYCNIHSLWKYIEDNKVSGCKSCEIHM